MNDRRSLFTLDSTLTYLNHASFGVPTRTALRRADSERRRLEQDTATHLGAELVQRLETQAAHVARRLRVPAGTLALTTSSTEGNAAVATSWPLSPGDHVLLLDLEYSSVIRAWQVAAERAGAAVDVAHLPPPVTQDGVLAAVSTAHPATTVVVLSAITSSTAVRMPVRDVVEACRRRGIDVVLDAAHVVGHVPLDLSALGVTAAFGSLHKWLPVPRPVGFLWLADRLTDVVRPAAVSLTWDATSLVERFSWRGTWDPAPALGLVHAFAEHDEWRLAGDLDSAVDVADTLATGLVDAGLRPTADGALVPPRLRGFVVDGVPLQGLRTALAEHRVRAWTGATPDGTPDGATLLRVATHVYNDAADLGPLTGALTAARDA
ncbi:aminotransferase class V-fold PLP-dependent enzyme [Actinotalea sp. M2MS4P-6]|uniref:aminotransferase class V-fold PLP-dependent enzyme n=1 Tax=Actinotalea sp. M2MS4P-6 TaxID=2983762 RepID=UPI0021E388A3|nr:aminotransferase class V-fold PLP-dependent enzyme [Actinotalea sp. M2MS4P-6]MCV2394401.1 aminotransferase class V-fold PLP-dependent enzyme [Actinotalea sp. M2MS4P-6]